MGTGLIVSDPVMIGQRFEFLHASVTGIVPHLGEEFFALAHDLISPLRPIAHSRPATLGILAPAEALENPAGSELDRAS